MKIWRILLVLTVAAGAWGLSNLVWSFDCLTSTGENEKAVASCTKVIDGPFILSAFHTSAIKRRSLANRGLSHYAETVADIDRLVSGDAASGLDYWNRGLANYQLKRLDAAAADLRAANEMMPGQEYIVSFFGDVLIENGKKDDALAVAEAFLASKPDSAVALRLRGWVRYLNEQYDQARADYDTAIKINSEEAGWWNERALVEEGQMQNDAALVDYSRAVALSPQDVQLRINRAKLLVYVGRAKDALNDYEKAVALDRSAYSLALMADTLIILERLDEAQTALDESVRLDPKSAFALTTYGRLLSERHDPKEAQAKYDQALALDPDNAGARYWIAMLRSDEGKFVTAYRMLANLESVWPKDATLQNDIGTALCSLGNYEKAIQAYSKAVALDPDYPLAYENRARAKLYLSQWQGAIDDADLALARDSTRAVAYFRRAYARWQLDDLNAALKDYDKAIELDAAFQAALEERAELHLAMEKPELALLDAEAALKLESPDDNTYRVRGLVAENLGKYDEAVAFYTKATDFNHYDSWHIEYRAWAYLGENEPLLALADCTTLIQHMPHRPEGYRCRARANQRIDDLPKALEDLNHALKIQSTFHPARFDRGYVLLTMQKPDEAIEDFASTIKAAYRPSESHYFRGIAHEDQGSISAALKDYEEALAIADKYWAADISARLRRLKSKNSSRAALDTPDYPQLRSSRRQ